MNPSQSVSSGSISGEDAQQQQQQQQANQQQVTAQQAPPPNFQLCYGQQK